MAYKTAAELFGDNGVFGTQVPIDFGPPSGVYAGTNRGIGFAEQLTSAIANRSHWALGENTDDLNTRLAVFEADGLDAAYRGGALATPGLGRVIVKDGDAVETVSAHSGLSEDNAHFRANSVSDTAGSSLGFEFVGKRAASNGQSGEDPVAGFLDRRVFASATGHTQLVHNEPAFLNPTGVLPTTVRIPGGSFHTGGATDLARNYDLVQVSGTASSDGLYIFSSIGAFVTDAVLEKLDGTLPAFALNEACTISVYRVRFGSFGSYTGRGRLYGAAVVGSPQALSALDIVPGANKAADLSGGSLSALRVMRRGANGSTTASADFDLFGRANWVIPRSSFLTNYDKNISGGGYATRVLAQESGMAGHQVEGEAAVSDRFDFTSLQEIDLVAYGVVPFSSALNFTANSPLDGEVLFSVAPSFEFDHLAPGVGGLVSILNTASAASDGLYWIHSTIISGTKGFYLRCLDGSVPVHFPAFGAFTVGRVYAGSVVGRRVMIDNPNPVEAGDTNKPVLASVLTGTNEVGATALGLVATRDPVGTGERSLIRGYRPAPAATDNYQEVFKVGSNGNVHTIGNITSAPSGSATTYARVNNSSFSAIAPGFSASYGAGSVGIADTATLNYLAADTLGVSVGTPATSSLIDATHVASDSFDYNNPTARSIIIPLADGQSEYSTSGGTHDWDLVYTGANRVRWESRAANGDLVLPLRIPNNCSIVNVLLVVTPIAALAFANRMRARLQTLDHDFTTPAPPAVTIIGYEVDSGVAGNQTLNLRSAPNATPSDPSAGFGVDQSVLTTSGSKEWLLHVTASSSGAVGVGDIIHSIRVDLKLNKPAPL